MPDAALGDLVEDALSQGADADVQNSLHGFSA
jgi:hypothetical protein